MRKFISALCVAVCASLFGMAASAQTYPTRPIRLIVPFAPGGTTDAVARVIGTRLAEIMGQPVVIDNRGGGGTVIGTEALARAPADGYTIMLATPDFTANPSLQSKLPYDTLKDFTPIGSMASYPMVMVVNSEHQIGSVDELIAKAKAKPGKINFASAGNGSMPHLCAELFNSMAGVQLTHVPYKGNGPAVADLLAGHVSMLFTGGPAVAPHIKGGKVKMLAVTTARRHPLLPDVPTIAESGVPGYEVTAWLGVLAPAGLPQDVAARLNQDIGRTLQSPETRERLSILGAELGMSTPQAFGALIRDEIDKWTRVVRNANVRVE